MRRRFKEKNRSILFFLSKYKKIYIPIFFLSIGYAVFEGINISVLLPLFDSALERSQSGGVLFGFLKKIIAALPFRDPFLNTVAMAVFVLATKEILGFARQYLIGFGVAEVVCETKRRVFDKYIRSDYQFFLDNKQGDLQYKAIHSSGRLGNCLQYIPDLLTSLFMFGTIGFLLFSISFSMTMALFIFAFIYNLLTRYLARQVSYHVGKERVILGSEASVILNEYIDGVKQIKLLDSADLWKKKFAIVLGKIKKLIVVDTLWTAIPERLMQLVPALILMLGAFFLKFSKEVPSALLLSNLAVIGIYVFGFYRLLPHLISIGKLRMQIMNTLPDVDHLYAILHEKTKFFPDGIKELDHFEKEIRFENVSFSYKNKERILSGINFTIDKGRITAIVGPSGSGKSTLANLMLKLFEPDKGLIAIDGIPIRDIKTSSLANLITSVSQEPFIFNATIQENILFGFQERTDKLILVSKLAYIHEFIMELPEQYQTIVGDKGLKLSGGQRQRIAIARAMLREPQILIFDEATSSLDPHSETLVQRAIENASKNRTVIIISHRLSAIHHADKIMVLANGGIVAQGDHHHLMNHEVYRDLFHLTAA
jgi:ABC-type multidrug transport system fused ATPase/permease subunit